jgi:hypothetical protein
MNDQARSISIADMPAQRPASPATQAEARGRFFNTGNAFNVQLPPVPDHIFTGEPARALDPDTATGLIPCDISGMLGCTFPATTPLVLIRYGRIRAGESLQTDFEASGVMIYVIAGAGSTGCDGEHIAWGAGDILVLPGGMTHVHAAEMDSVLWIVTNEPQLAFENLRAPAPGRADRRHLRNRPDRADRRVRADLLGGAPGSIAQHPADLDAGDEFTARRQRAAAAPAQCRRRQPDHQGRALLLHHGRKAQGLGAMGDDHHAAGFGPLTS